MVQIIMPVIESKFAFLKIKIKRFSPNSAELCQTGFSITPEAFNTVNMGLSSNKPLLPMMDSKVFFVSQINQSIVSTLPI